MTKKFLLIMLISLSAALPCLAAAWRPVAETGNGLTFTHMVKGDDEVALRTSLYLEASVTPIDIVLDDLLIGLYASYLINGDSIIEGHLRLLGYQQAEAGVRMEYQFTPLYSLYMLFGCGYGRLNSSESGFALAGITLGHRFAVMDMLSLSAKYSLTYRLGFLDHRIGVAIVFTPAGSIREV